MCGIASAASDTGLRSASASSACFRSVMSVTAPITRVGPRPSGVAENDAATPRQPSRASVRPMMRISDPNAPSPRLTPPRIVRGLSDDHPQQERRKLSRPFNSAECLRWRAAARSARLRRCRCRTCRSPLLVRHSKPLLSRSDWASSQPPEPRSRGRRPSVSAICLARSSDAPRAKRRSHDAPARDQGNPA
jgi:hypothetical protein